MRSETTAKWPFLGMHCLLSQFNIDRKVDKNSRNMERVEIEIHSVLAGYVMCGMVGKCPIRDILSGGARV